MTSDLDQSIERTLRYFAQFSYPLSAFEVWKWLLYPSRPYGYEEVQAVLGTSSTGFYGLGDIAAQMIDRHTCHRDAIRKHRRALWVARALALVPWVQGIAICNSLAWHHTRPESDIDFFIVTKPGKVWLTRLWTTGPLRILGLRPQVKNTDPICLSFFVDEDHLSMEPFALTPRDPYLAYWCLSLSPILDRCGWVERFAKENMWVKKILPNAPFAKRSKAFRLERAYALPWLPGFEGFARAIQEKYFPENIRSLMNIDSRVVVNDHVLKFHLNDRRAEFAKVI